MSGEFCRSVSSCGLLSATSFSFHLLFTIIIYVYTSGSIYLFFIKSNHSIFVDTNSFSLISGQLIIKT